MAMAVAAASFAKSGFDQLDGQEAGNARLA